MTRALMLFAVLLAACEGTPGPRYEVRPDQVALANSPPDAACGAGAPDRRFIPSPQGVPDQWIVVLRQGPSAAVAPGLVEDYGGTVTHTWTILEGFGVKDLPHDGALLMSIDPRVCWVEQDGYVHAD